MHCHVSIAISIIFLSTKIPLRYILQSVRLSSSWQKHAERDPHQFPRPQVRHSLFLSLIIFVCGVVAKSMPMSVCVFLPHPKLLPPLLLLVHTLLSVPGVQPLDVMVQAISLETMPHIGGKCCQWTHNSSKTYSVLPVMRLAFYLYAGFHPNCIKLNGHK